MKKLNVLVIGANGYIGSKIINKLKKTTINWVGIDSLLRSDNNAQAIKIYSENSYQNLKNSYLDEFTDCIWVAGHSSVSMSINDEYGALRNNLFDLINFTNIFRGRLIYASSGSVYSRINAELSKEDSPLFAAANMYDYTKICFDNYIKASNKKNVIGLRFGTVNGGSDRFRGELIINSMTQSAAKNGYLWVSNGGAKRSILFIDDLVNAVIRILESNINTGIYNLCSFNSNILDIANNISDHFKAELILKPDASTYNFMMNTTLFKETFDFEFNGDLSSIIGSIIV